MNTLYLIDVVTLELENTTLESFIVPLFIFHSKINRHKISCLNCLLIMVVSGE